MFKMKEKDRIIFLDIDGVVNTLQIDIKPFPGKENKHFDGFYYDLCYNNDGRVSNRQAVMWLNKLCIETGAKIVISSTWRYCERPGEYTTEECLRNTGLLLEIEIIGKTPVMSGHIRGDEINQWLIDHYGNNLLDVSFVILDDDADMGNLIECLVQTHVDYGFNYPEYKKALDILLKN